MSLTKEFASLWSGLQSRLADLAIEAKTLRDSPGEFSELEDVSDLISRLVRTRQAQDRLEAIIADVGRVRSRARLMVSEARDEYENALYTAMQSSRIGEYSSADERRMTYKAASFNEYRVLRQAEKKESEISEVFEYCLLKFRGLDSSRRDVEARARMLNVQTTLDY